MGEAFGSRAVAVHLPACARELLRSSLAIETPRGLLEVPLEPGPALAAAVRFGLHLTADLADVLDGLRPPPVVWASFERAHPVRPCRRARPPG